MAKQVELIMPKMGESIAEATILKWLKQEGETIELDESVLEIATDKVDSEVPSPISGTLIKILHPEGAVVPVGQAVALIALAGEGADIAAEADPNGSQEAAKAQIETAASQASTQQSNAPSAQAQPIDKSAASRFYSPLVLNIARSEGISMSELENMAGTGKEGRVTKKDILDYVENRGSAPQIQAQPQTPATQPAPQAAQTTPQPQSQTQYKVDVSAQPGDEIIIPSYTFVSTANAFVLRGATIIFADSSAENPNIDASRLENLIT
ncbi:MAG: biotin/lipoyl-containing protein, partial [Bacteroidia bacterium]